MSKADGPETAQALAVEVLGGRFDKFTERARKVLVLAQEEARRYNHHHLGTEHVLLGLVRERAGIASKVLSNLGVGEERVRSGFEMLLHRGDDVSSGDRELTARAIQALEFAVDEARQLGHYYIGTEHLLLGLLRDAEAVAVKILQNLGLELPEIRAEVHQVLARFEPGGPKNNVVMCRLDDHSLAALDTLIEVGARATRSEAAAWLIRVGIEAQAELFETMAGTVAEIRRLRENAQAAVRQATAQAPRSSTAVREGGSVGGNRPQEGPA